MADERAQLVAAVSAGSLTNTEAARRAGVSPGWMSHLVAQYRSSGDRPLDDPFRPTSGDFVNTFLTTPSERLLGVREDKRKILTRFADWLAPAGLLDATTEQVAKWLDPNEPLIVATFEGFYQWAVTGGLRADNPMAPLRCSPSGEISEDDASDLVPDDNDAVDTLYRALLSAVGDHARQGGTAIGTALVMKRAALELGITAAETATLPRLTQTELERVVWGRMITKRRVTATKPGRCLWCGRQLGAPGSVGRPRLYCRRSCRQRHYEAQRLQRLTDVLTGALTDGP